ncbi:amidohydrolase family protein [Dermatobacter hominis]|uniref:amidohydrolase family protein n=1 Tax=Dermatobacter hominis TaxID=2884263 RepID=UPI001D0FC003|nr:amidohydrolase family protein [Dermatobacter hominis]UDY35898.1 amidohydrolase family protein [Dermatobacter hominis]
MSETGVVDSHVHLLPGRLGAKVRSIFEDLGGYRLAYEAEHSAVCEQLAAEGVSTIWTLPYAHRPDVAEGLNEAAAATAASDLAVDVVAGATVHPGDDDPVGVVRRAVEDGGARVLKLHCSVGDFGPLDPGLRPVWDYVEEVRLPVVVHAGRAPSGVSDEEDLAPLDELARRHPEARVIIAHCGHDQERHALRIVAEHPNVHADLTPVVNRLVQITPDDAARHADRLLFGTDAPNTELTAARCRAHVDGFGLGPEALGAVLGGNARRLVADVRS